MSVGFHPAGIDRPHGIERQMNSDHSTIISERWRRPARLGWILILLLVVGTLLAGAPARLSLLKSDPYDLVQGLDQIGASIEFFAIYFTFLEIGFALLFLFVGVLIFWKAGDDWMALLVSAAFVTMGVSSPLADALSAGNAGWLWPVLLLRVLTFDLTLLVFYLFPDGRFVPRWTRWLVWAFILYSGLWFVFPQLVPPMAILVEATNWRALGQFTPLALLVLIGIASQIYRYRRVSNAARRQQTKWVVFGFVAFFLSVCVILVPFALSSSLRDGQGGNILYILVAGPLLLLAAGLIPITTALAILRYRLWDISLVVRRTVTYSLFTLLLLAIYLLVVVLFQSLLRLVTDQESPLVIAVSTLVIAALFNPLRKRTQTFIDRRFYRRKYDAQKTLAAFAATARDDVDLEQLSTALLRVVTETVQPESLSLWLKTPAGTGPHFARREKLESTRED